MANKSDLHFGGELKLMAVSQTFILQVSFGGGSTNDHNFMVGNCN